MKTASPPGNLNSGATLSPRQQRMEALGQQVQNLIDQIPDDQEDELRAMLRQHLDPWEIVPTYQNLPFLGSGIVEAMNDLGFLPIPEELPQPINLEPDESPLMALEEWLLEHLP